MSELINITKEQIMREGCCTSEQADELIRLSKEMNQYPVCQNCNGQGLFYTPFSICACGTCGGSGVIKPAKKPSCPS